MEINKSSTLRSMAAHNRREKIVELAREAPRTIRELEQITGASYHTVRLDIESLLAQGIVKSCGLRAGSIIFTSNLEAKHGWPIVFSNESSTRGVGLKTQMNKNRAQDYVTDAVKAAVVLELLPSRLMCWAQDSKDGNFDKQTVEQEEQQTRLAIAALKELVFRSESLLSNKECWTKAGLNRIAVIDDFPLKKHIQILENTEIPLVLESLAAMLNSIQKGRKDATERDVPGGNSSGAG